MDTDNYGEASCPIGVDALLFSQRICTRPATVCTPVKIMSVSSSSFCFSFDSPNG